MATAEMAAQKYDQLMSHLNKSERKARVVIASARSAQSIKEEIFGDADLKAKVKAIADARGETITGIGNRMKNASDAVEALLPFYPDPVVEPGE